MVEYQGVHGIVEIDGVAVAVGEFSVKFPRGIASFARSGKYSDLKLPGKIDCTGSLKRIMIDGDLMQKVLNTATAGSAAELHAGVAFPDAATNTIQTMTDEASLSSLIKLTVLVAATSASGQIILHGTDVNDAQQTEIITVASGLDVDDTITGTKVFKTLEYATLSDYVQGVGGTMKFEAITGAAQVTTLGVAEYFTLKGKASSGNSYIEINLTDCWFTEGGLAFTDADAIIEETLPFVVKDLDTGTSVKWLTG